LLNFIDDFSARNRHDARDVLHHDPPRVDALHDPQVLPKQSCPRVSFASLMIIDRITLAWGAPNDHINLAALSASSFQQLRRCDRLYRTSNKSRFGVGSGEGLARSIIIVLPDQNMKACLSETLG